MNPVGPDQILLVPKGFRVENWKQLIGELSRKVYRLRTENERLTRRGAERPAAPRRALFTGGSEEGLGTMTNKEQKVWLDGAKAAGSLGQVGSADIILGGELKSLPGDEALELLVNMSEEELAASLNPEAEAQANGDPGADPTSASPDSSESSPVPSEAMAGHSESAGEGSTPSEGSPSESSSATGGEPGPGPPDAGEPQAS